MKINKSICSLALAAPLILSQNVYAGQRPNIVFFLVDDFGWTESSLPFGEKIYPNNQRFKTPNMERLSKKGVMMTNAYACPVSTPTRASLMTGMNPAHMKITSFISLYKDIVPDAIGGHPGATNENLDDIFAHPEWNYNAFCPVSLEPERETYGLNHTLYATPMVEILRDAGYHTIHVGKAHWGPAGTPGSNPYNMGFVVNIAGSSNGHPKSYLPEDNFGNLPGKGDYGSVQNMSQYYGTDVHLTEAMTREALKTLEHPIRQKIPFYLYFSHYSNHTPIQRDKRYIQPYLGAGMDDRRAMLPWLKAWIKVWVIYLISLRLRTWLIIQLLSFTLIMGDIVLGMRRVGNLILRISRYVRGKVQFMKVVFVFLCFFAGRVRLVPGRVSIRLFQRKMCSRQSLKWQG